MRSLKIVIIALMLGLFMSGGVYAQWDPDVRLTDDPSDSVTCFENAKAVAVLGDTVHVVWHDGRDGNTEIYYNQSTDDGATWGTDTAITADASWSERPAVAVSGSTVHVAWYDGRLGPPRIYYKHSLDDGATWGSDVCLTPTAGVAYHPSVAVSGSTVHLAWTDMSAGPQIYYTRSTDNGVTWEAERNITPSAPAAGKNLASIAVSGSTVHVVWMDFRADARIYYTRSADSGVTWDVDKSITTTTSQFPSIVANGSVLHVVYSDFRDGEANPRIYYLRSQTLGDSWEPEVELAAVPASWYPSVAVSGSFVQVVWLDNRNGDVSEVYGRSSTDGGDTWNLTRRLTNNASESREPSVAVSDTSVHAIWHDDRDGNWEVYYKHRDIATSTVSADLSAVPSSGTLPFTAGMSVSLSNNYSGQSRRLAGLIDVDLAGGQHFSNWKSGWSNVAAGSMFSTDWNQSFPALGNLVGDNIFLLVAEDVTPAPYNQPPYPAAGDTDTSACTVTGIAPCP